MVRLLILLVLAPVVLSAQITSPEGDSTRFDSRVEIGISYSILSINGTVPLPGAALASGSECGLFQEGSGRLTGSQVGFHHSITSKFGLLVAAGVEVGGTTMSFPCVEEADIRLPDGRIVPAVTEFIRDEDRTDLSLGIGGTALLYRGAFAEVGLLLRYTLGAERSYTENIVTPASATFVDGGQQTRHLGGGSYGVGDGWEIGGMIGLGYLLPAGDRLELIPRVTAGLPMKSNNESGISSARVSFGLSAAYSFELFPGEQSSPLEPGSD